MNLAIRQDVPLAPLTTIGIGGPARFFVQATSVDEIRAAVSWALDNGEALFFLGGGSNLLISDEGFKGLVVQVGLRGVTLESEDEYATVKVAAGERWDDFVAVAVHKGWAGIECLSGIPGSTGATPIQNVGAYGQEVSETIIRVEVLDLRDGPVKSLTKWDCRFGYRSSLFKNFERDRYVVLNVTFRLKIGGEASVRYPELQKILADHGTGVADLQGVRDAVLAIRRRKGMVLDPGDPDTRSDGSFFMNPVVSNSELETFMKKARAVVGVGESVPHFPAGDSVKLSAAWLIEHAGFQKGYARGKAGLSTKHTLAVINRGEAKATDVLQLVEEIRGRVRDTFGLELHAEPNFIGFEARPAIL
jgi:UDP-N-acetylmuramate dehydrogenase